LGKNHKITEEILVALLKEKQKQGMDILYDNYSAVLYGVIFRIVRSEELADDLLQEVFVKIWKNFSQYDPGKSRLYTWIIHIARNLAIDKVRSREFVNSGKNQDIENVVPFDPGSNNTYNPDVIGVKELAGQLSADQQMIIDLLYFKGYTQAEVAEELNLPLGTVKTRVRLAINILRRKFELTQAT
jgi:RNA polymerase sigma factor (sigma-70 family)